MPWHVEKDHNDCPESKPYAVVKDANGEVEGCHETKEEADAQVRALYANEEDASVSPAVTARQAAEELTALASTPYWETPEWLARHTEREDRVRKADAQVADALRELNKLSSQVADNQREREDMQMLTIGWLTDAVAAMERRHEETERRHEEMLSLMREQAAANSEALLAILKGMTERIEASERMSENSRAAFGVRFERDKDGRLVRAVAEEGATE